MHRTETIDYVIVLEGEIEMDMDNSTVKLRAGDVMVQRGTNHAWANRGSVRARVAFRADRRECRSGSVTPSRERRTHADVVRRQLRARRTGDRLPVLNDAAGSGASAREDQDDDIERDHATDIPPQVHGWNRRGGSCARVQSGGAASWRRRARPSGSAISIRSPAIAYAAENNLNGMSLYFESIGGTIAGRKIEIIKEDDQFNPQVGLQKAKKLVESDKVDNDPRRAGEQRSARRAQLLAKQQKAFYVVSGAGTDAITWTATPISSAPRSLHTS